MKRLLRGFSGLLGVSFVILLLLNILIRLPSGSEDEEPEVAEATPTPAEVFYAEPSNRQTLIDTITATYLEALGDANTLDAQLATPPPSCDVELARPEPISISEVDQIVYPDLGFVTTMNIMLEQLATVTETWDALCTAPDSTTPEQVTTAQTTITDVRDAIELLGTDLNTATSNPAATNPPPTLAAPPTSTPTVAPTATNTPIPGTIIRDLNTLTENTRVAVDALLNNQLLVLQAGEQLAFGCSVGQLGDDFPTPDEDLAQAEPELASAIGILNSALATTRTLFNDFETNCRNGTLPPDIIQGYIAQANEVLEALIVVNNTLENYQ